MRLLRRRSKELSKSTTLNVVILEGLTQRQLAEGKVILPVWHGVDHEYILKFSPPLANRLSVSTLNGIESIADAIEKVVRSPSVRDTGADDINPSQIRRRKQRNRSWKGLLLVSAAAVIALVLYVLYVRTRHMQSTLAPANPIAETVQQVPPKILDHSPNDYASGVEIAGPIKNFAANPDQVRAGQSFQLQWKVTNGVAVLLDQNPVDDSGTRTYQPTQTTTYTLEVQDELGKIIGRRYVTVRVLPPHPHTARNLVIGTSPFTVYDVYFDPGEVALDAAAINTLRNMRDTLGAILTRRAVVIEGHADEKGSAEVNLGIGDQRATAVKDFLVQLGLPSDKLKTISYGKERPVGCSGPYESCAQLNRRVAFSLSQ